MIGFHIDMNMAQFRGEYLERWLKELAGIGYDTILWEVENNVRWETCPECVSPDAFSKKEFRRILDCCRKLRLECIPLLQTIGHSEYALKHERYAHLRERPESAGQYCARNPKVIAFLRRWIEEYLDLFGPIRRFHLGADEAHGLGRCDACKAYVQKHSVSELYIRHINAVSRLVLDRGIQPVVWADMLLTHPQALAKLSRRIMLFDWRYDIYRGMKGVNVWGMRPGFFGTESVPEDVLRQYGRYMFPLSRELSREPDPFYTADYLAANGFDVVGCPASSCYRDSVFAPTHWLHLNNTFSWMRKGTLPNLRGTMVTSWTVRLVPWELQLSAIDTAGFVPANPDRTVEAYQTYFMRKRFGTDDPAFWRATGLLSKSCLFMESQTLGFYKGCKPTPAGHVSGILDEVVNGGRLDAELAIARERLADYCEARTLLRRFAKKARKGRALLDMWDWAARNLINRARVTSLLLRSRTPDGITGTWKRESRKTLADLKRLRSETQRLYLTMQKPTRTGEIVAWMYDSVAAALSECAGKA